MSCSRTDLMELLASIIEKNRSDGRNEHLQIFIDTLCSKGYEDYLERAITNAFTLEYMRVTRSMAPSSQEEMKKRGNNLRSQIQSKDITKAKSIIAGNLMEMITPLNKPLKDCTGDECLTLGGFYQRIGSEAGELLIGEYFTEDELQRAMTDQIS